MEMGYSHLLDPDPARSFTRGRLAGGRPEGVALHAAYGPQTGLSTNRHIGAPCGGQRQALHRRGVISSAKWLAQGLPSSDLVRLGRNVRRRCHEGNNEAEAKLPSGPDVLTS